jgi:hypothetical protein
MTAFEKLREAAAAYHITVADVHDHCFLDMFPLGSQRNFCWNDWRSHVPVGIAMLWSDLDIETRLAVFLTAKSVTMWKERSQEATEAPVG